MVAALDWQANEALRCGGCGLPLDETINPAEAAAWVAEPVVCNGCSARERKASSMNDGDKRMPAGTKFRLRNRASEEVTRG